MRREKRKLYIAIIFLIYSLGLIWNDTLFMPFPVVYLNLLIIIYVIFDALVIFIPHKDLELYSTKFMTKNYSESTQFNEDKYKKLKRQQDLKAVTLFLVYFGLLTILGLLYLKISKIPRETIYLLFAIANFADYFCILIYCPFRNLYLHNKCCSDCRISNWDRLMKYFILFFSPYLILLIPAFIGLIIFIHWEYYYFKYPKRFYSITNNALSCSMCQIKCKKSRL